MGILYEILGERRMPNLKSSFYEILIDNVSDMVFVMRFIDGQFLYQYLNKVEKEKSQYDHHIIGKSIHEANAQEKAKILYKRYRKAADEQTTVTYQDTFISKKGEKRYAKTTLTPVIGHDQKCTYIIAVVKDITHKVMITRELTESKRHFELIAENASDLITLIDHRGKIIYVSPSYQRILGFNRTEYIGKEFLHNVHPNHQKQVYKKMREAVKHGKRFHVEFKQYSRQNHTIWCEARGTPIYDQNKKFKQIVVVTRDISKQKKYQEKLKYLALHDSLTGLPNRRLFQQHLKRHFNKFKESKTPFSVMMLDIDHFKRVNDEMGHEVGDQVIEECGKRIKKAIGEENFAARLGGDEFAILLPKSSSLNYISSMVKNIQKKIQKPWHTKNYTFSVTTSIGIAVVSSQDQDASSILKKADKALYEAKSSGGDTFKMKQDINSHEILTKNQLP